MILILVKIDAFFHVFFMESEYILLLVMSCQFSERHPSLKQLNSF